MSIKDKIIDIIQTMIEYGMIDKNRIYDQEYILERVNAYINTKKFVMDNFKGMF